MRRGKKPIPWEVLVDRKEKRFTEELIVELVDVVHKLDSTLEKSHIYLTAVEAVRTRVKPDKVV